MTRQDTFDYLDADGATQTIRFKDLMPLVSKFADVLSAEAKAALVPAE